MIRRRPTQDPRLEHGRLPGTVCMIVRMAELFAKQEPFEVGHDISEG